MGLTRDDVARLADLARIELTPDELAHLAPQIDVIVEAVAGVAEVKDDDIPPLAHPLGIVNVARADEPQPTDWRVLQPIIEQDAPAWQDERFRVPRILEEEA
ncbi:MAG: Asp-tRNA(Asn)/Glu-tRNA(Gln) amidotransferase subunit GatC [Propionibacteriaceae bacterium]|nr:Asp-tRNA(Asn)/Glu-tRNA(Gln) amidotransferase subunit GatC [Propionibacteriaceae bacterium]